LVFAPPLFGGFGLFSVWRLYFSNLFSLLLDYSRLTYHLINFHNNSVAGSAGDAGFTGDVRRV
jgi:hypothetical protein